MFYECKLSHFPSPDCSTASFRRTLPSSPQPWPPSIHASRKTDSPFQLTSENLTPRFQIRCCTNALSKADSVAEWTRSRIKPGSTNKVRKTDRQPSHSSARCAAMADRYHPWDGVCPENKCKTVIKTRRSMCRSYPTMSRRTR